MESSSQPPNHPTAQPSNRLSTALVVGGVWMIVTAAFLFLCGMCSAFFYLILPLTTRGVRDDVSANVVLGSLAGLGVLLGTVLVWQGVNILRRRESRIAARSFPRTIVFVSAFLLVIVMGLGALSIQPIAAYIFPPWHFLAASLPPLAFLAYAARRLGDRSGLRALVTAFSWGALGATSLVMLLEILTGIALVLFAALVFVITPEGKALLSQLSAELPRMRSTLDLTTVASLLTNPAVAIGALAYFSIVVPVIEETLKTLVVAFVDARRTHLADMVLWSVSASVGFAIVENLLNVSAEWTAWALAALLRVGATTMHVTNGVTMGRGWYAARVERRWDRLVIALGMSVLVHAAWNAAAISLSGVGLVLLSRPRTTIEAMLPGGLLIGALAVVLIVLTTGGLTWIAHSVRSVRTVREPAS